MTSTIAGVVSTAELPEPTYFDGSNPPDSAYTYAWTGAVNNSTSVRLPVRRRAWAKMEDAIQPETNQPGTVGEFTVSLVLPYGVWEDAVAGQGR